VRDQDRPSTSKAAESQSSTDMSAEVERDTIPGDVAAFGVLRVGYLSGCLSM